MGLSFEEGEKLIRRCARISRLQKAKRVKSTELKRKSSLEEVESTPATSEHVACLASAIPIHTDPLRLPANPTTSTSRSVLPPSPPFTTTVVSRSDCSSFFEPFDSQLVPPQNSEKSSSYPKLPSHDRPQPRPVLSIKNIPSLMAYPVPCPAPCPEVPALRKFLRPPRFPKSAPSRDPRLFPVVRPQFRQQPSPRRPRNWREPFLQPTGPYQPLRYPYPVNPATPLYQPWARTQPRFPWSPQTTPHEPLSLSY